MTEPERPAAEEHLGIFLLPLVLLPFDELALHATNRRHSQLIADLRRKGSDEFGIVFVERGSQAGADGRTLVGTVADLEVSSPYTHGRWSLIVQGRRRFRVLRWVNEEPYPIAAIESLADLELARSDALTDDAESAVRRVRSLLAELGDGSALALDYESAHDPVAFSWKLAAASPLNPGEKQRLLEIDDPKERLHLLIELMDALYGDFAPLGRNGG